MLKRMELWDFESHKHTVVDDFSAGLNLVCGESNAGKCLTGDTVILDRDGSMRTILDMFKQGGWYVPSVAKNGKFLFERASCVAANGEKPVFVLETRRGRRIKATDNHKFFTPLGWKTLKELKGGDWIAIARRMPVFGQKKLPQGHARLIGYLLGDGGVTEAVSFTNEEDDVLNDFKRLVLSLENHHFETRPAGNAVSIFPSKPLDTHNRHMGKSGIAMFCDEYGLSGCNHNTKHIPDVIFNCCEDDIKDVVRGLIITDGWVHKRLKTNSFEVGFCTTSEVLSRQLSHLLTRFGIVSVVRRKKTTWEYLGEKKNGLAYSVDVHGRRFVCKIGEVLGYDFVGKKSGLLKRAVQSHDMDRTICRYDGVPRTKKMIDVVRKAVKDSGKSESVIRREMGLHGRTALDGSKLNQSFGITFLEKLADVTGSKEIRDIVESDIFWDRVKKIEKAGVEPTFDIEVPKTHTFFANDIYTHNTSLVRALKLVAYNEFDPHSIRVGATKCKVLVETDKGTVKVTRGSKNNLWEITKNGQPTEYFDKVGVDVVPAAVEVMGLNMVSLGDVQVPVNIMDQLESHFMLKGVGDKNASGSMRAQIVDEISGLSGIEGLIKSVSLDNHRFGREVTEIEGRMDEVKKQLHDEKMLGEESDRLGKAENMLNDADDSAVAVGNMVAMEGEFDSLSREIEDKTSKLDALPDDALAMAALKDGDENIHWAVEAEKLERDIESVSKSVNELGVKMAGMPDVKKASVVLKKAEGVLSKASTAEGLEKESLESKKRITELQETAKKLGNPEKAKELVDKAQESMESVSVIGEMQRELKDAGENVGIMEKRLKDYEEMYEVAVKERDEAVGAVKVCPLTLGPVSEECIKTAKGV